jgi:hypothetical protein
MGEQLRGPQQLPLLLPISVLPVIRMWLCGMLLHSHRHPSQTEFQWRHCCALSESVNDKKRIAASFLRCTCRVLSMICLKCFLNAVSCCLYHTMYLLEPPTTSDIPADASMNCKLSLMFECTVPGVDEAVWVPADTKPRPHQVQTAHHHRPGPRCAPLFNPSCSDAMLVCGACCRGHAVMACLPGGDCTRHHRCAFQ